MSSTTTTIITNILCHWLQGERERATNSAGDDETNPFARLSSLLLHFTLVSSVPPNTISISPSFLLCYKVVCFARGVCHSSLAFCALLKKTYRKYLDCLRVYDVLIVFLFWNMFDYFVYALFKLNVLKGKHECPFACMLIYLANLFISIKWKFLHKSLIPFSLLSSTRWDISWFMNYSFSAVTPFSHAFVSTVCLTSLRTGTGLSGANIFFFFTIFLSPIHCFFYIFYAIALISCIDGIRSRLIPSVKRDNITVKLLY